MGEDLINEIADKSDSGWTSRTKAAAIAIILIAAAIRLWGLGDQSVWQDEAYSAVLARQDVSTIVQMQVDDSSPPLYYLLLHFWTSSFGDSEFVIRLLSALFGIGLVAAVLFITSSLFNRSAGLWAGGMLAFAPLAVYYSQEARMYSLTPLLAILSVYFCHLVSDNPTPKRVAWFIGITAGLLYTQNYGVFILLVDGLYLLARRRERRDPRPMLALSGVVLLYLPWLIVLSRQVVGNTTAWILPPHLRMLVDTALHLTFKSWRIPTTGLLKVSWGIGLAAALVVLVQIIVFAVRLIQSSQASERACSWPIFLVLGYMVLPIACAFISSYSKPIYVAGRYDSIVQPGVYMLLGLGIASIPLDWLRKALGILLFAVLLISLHAYFTTYWKSNDRDVANWVANNATESDLVLFTDLTVTPFLYYHPNSDVSRIRFPQAGLGYMPAGFFSNDLSYFEDEFRSVIRKVSAQWPRKRRLLVVLKPYRTSDLFVSRLNEESWLRLMRHVSFPAGHNAENQVSEIIIYDIIKAPEL